MIVMMYEPQGIRNLLNTNDRAVERAMVALYNRQTADERSADNTLHPNGVGFSAFHAKLGSYYAKWVLAGKNLSGQHLEKARKIALYYTGQLTEIANCRSE